MNWAKFTLREKCFAAIAVFSLAIAGGTLAAQNFFQDMELSSLADWIQAATAIAGVAGLIFTLRQNTAALKSAAASNVLAHKDFVESHPPHLRVQWIRGRDANEPELILFEVALVNDGANDAIVTSTAFAACNAEYMLDQPVTPEDQTPLRITPGARGSITVGIHVPNETLQPILNEERKLYLKGNVFYGDDLGVQRYRTIYRVYDHVSGRFRKLPIGSDFANDELQD